MSLLLAALVVAAAPGFGPFEASDLAGHAVRVPDRLPGQRRVLLVAFERERAEPLDRAWERLAPLEREIPGLAVVQTPVIGRVNGLLQAVIVGSQRLFVPAERRARYVPLFIDRKDAMAALAVKEPGVCLALVVEGAALRTVLGDACAPDLPDRVRSALAALAPAQDPAGAPVAPLPGSPPAPPPGGAPLPAAP